LTTKGDWHLVHVIVISSRVKRSVITT
jgi:hypothetical protein